jgi:S1-C subfamily serine protease/DNA-binding response OmpR family regulator
MRVLLFNLSADSLRAANNALAGRGYDVSTHRDLTVDQLLTLSPDVLVTEITSSDMNCWTLVSQLKARPQTEPSFKILLIVRGGPLERACGLDLGADDVISFPIETVEFAAKVRTQFRKGPPQEEFDTMLKYAVLQKQFVDVVVKSLSSLPSKRRFWLNPAIFTLCAAAAFSAVYIGISSRGTRKETHQLRADIARLTSGIGQQSELLRHAEFASGAFEALSRSASAARGSLKVQSEDLGKRVADVDSLGNTRNRLRVLETESKIAQTVVHDYRSSVCLLHVVVEFLDQHSGRPIQIAVDAAGKPLVDDNRMVELVEDGAGPHLRIDVFGTGFLVRRDGTIVTNHHIVEPWWENEELGQLLAHGASAYVLSYEVYFPGKALGLHAKLDRISPQADVATLRRESPLPSISVALELDDRPEATVTGDPVVLIGYPTGIEGLLAKAGTDVVQKISAGAQDVTQIMSKVASQQLIRPTTTQGHIGDVLEDKIVYDAATTSGSSGGPPFNRNGKVIGITFAVLRDFGGSNLAVPAKYVTELLSR